MAAGLLAPTRLSILDVSTSVAEQPLTSDSTTQVSDRSQTNFYCQLLRIQ